MFALDHLESADTASDVDAHPLFVLGSDLQAGLSQREFRGRNPKLNKSTHFFDLFAVDILVWIEILHLSGNPGIEERWIECLNAGDPIAAFTNGLPALLGADTERAQQADTRYYNSARQN